MSFQCCDVAWLLGLGRNAECPKSGSIPTHGATIRQSAGYTECNGTLRFTDQLPAWPGDTGTTFNSPARSEHTSRRPTTCDSLLRGAFYGGIDQLADLRATDDARSNRAPASNFNARTRQPSVRTFGHIQRARKCGADMQVTTVHGRQSVEVRVRATSFGFSDVGFHAFLYASARTYK